MKFTVLPDRKSTPRIKTQYALKRSDWDDFGFRIFYQLFRRNEDRDEEPDLIGSVRILFPGGSTKNRMEITEDFTSLPLEARSVGTSLDYYERLSALPDKERAALMAALNDLVASPELRSETSEYDGYGKSMFRDVEDIEDFFEDADAVLRSDFSQLPDLSEPFTFQPGGWDDPLEFNFDGPADPLSMWRAERMGTNGPRVIVPRRVAVLIGRNGCGKSTLLSRLARVAFASPSDRKTEKIAQLGKISPPEFGFTRIVSISYSAFDSFQIPGLHGEERAQISRDIKNGQGRFIFCGLRDIAAEYGDQLDELASEEDDAERRSSTKLKDLNDLASEFAELLKMIEKKDRLPVFQDGLKVILSDASFGDFEEQTVADLVGDDPARAFMQWSTGHKIAIHVLACITAHCQRKSIVLFDEPETHLHPPLIAALMRALRIVLEQTNAFCIVATHSPVILQETLARHVFIIERDGEIVSVRQPQLETFGESIGALTYDSFGLTAENTYFSRTLKRLANSADEPDELEALFPLGLSAQAEALVMSFFARKRQDDDG